MVTASTGHPYFREERKRSKFQKFIQGTKEDMQDVSKRAREWRLAQGDAIIVIGHAWSYEPTADEERRGPSSYDHVLTITYVDAVEGGPKQSIQEAYPDESGKPVPAPPKEEEEAGKEPGEESGGGTSNPGTDPDTSGQTPPSQEEEEDKKDPQVPELGDTDSFPPADGEI